MTDSDSKPVVTQDAHASGGSTIIQVGRDATITMVGHAVERIEDDPVGECPYPGLSAFGVEQAKWFFGREGALAELRVRLDQARGEGGPVVVIGASGAGKSSLLRSGLIASVATNGYGDAGSRNWPYLVFTPTKIPTKAPVLALATELAALTGADRDQFVVTPTNDPTACAAALRRTLGVARLLLVVDQFEEIFTDCDDEDQRTAFVDLLDALCAGPDSPAMVVLGLRADFYGHCLTYPRLAAAVRDAPVQLAQLTRSELVQAVLGPAEQVGLTVQPGLLQVLLADMGVGAVPGEDPSGRLPLLAHALRATWFKRSGKTLTLEGYHDTGGIHGAIATTADRTLRRLGESLGEPALPAARLVFLRLVRIGADTEDTRRHVTHDELTQGLPDPAAAAEVVNAYTSRRLLTQERGGVTITHEALLRAWQTLRSWIDADRAGHLFRQELEAHVRSWENAGRETSAQYQGATLENAQRWAAQHPDDVTASIAEFLAASRRAETGRRRLRRNVMVLVTVLALVASGMAVYAFTQRGNALAQRDRAVAQLVANEAEFLLDSHPGLAKQLSVISYRLDKHSGTGALFASLGASGIFDAQDSVADVAATRDGRTLAISTGTAIALWSTAGHAQGRINDLSVGSVALSPDNRLLAAATTGSGTTGVVRLWSIADPLHPQPLASLPAESSDVASVAISADGRLLAAGTSTGAILLWDLTAPNAPRALPSLSGHDGGVDSLAFAPSGPILASSGADHAVRLWQLSDPAPATLVSTVDGYHGDDNTDSTKYTKVRHRVAFRQDGMILAAPGDGNTSGIRLWDVKNPASPRMAASPAGDLAVNECRHGLRSISFSPDSKVLATVCNTGGVILWQTEDLSTVTDTYALPGISDDGNGPAIFEPEPDSHLLLHATPNGVQQWDVTNFFRPDAMASLGRVPGGFEVSMTFSRGPKRLLAVVGVYSGVLWDLTGLPPHHKLADLPGGYIEVGAAAFNPDGSVLADSEHDGDYLVLRLRSTTAPTVPILATVDGEIDNGVHGLAFSPDGRILAVADNNDYNPARTKPPAVKLFDVTDLTQPKQIVTLPGDVFAVAFSPDGRLLVANTTDTLLSWNVSDPRHPVQQPTQRLTPSSNSSASAFRPDGQLIAVGDSSGTIRLWRVANDQLVDEPSVLHPSGYTGDLAFSPDGQTLAWSSNGSNRSSNSAMGSPHIELWDVSEPRVPLFQAALAFANNSVPLIAASLAYSANGRLLVTGNSGTIDVWSADPDAQADTLCGSIGDVITREQWTRYVRNEPYNPPCPR